ncbi:DUF4167 domain-containing protein [Aquabacter sp. CN5-332]|uniref:DUF4167 domain-containing protein n=1 Tax=Aquabacter sp. CN5-332 TaxID=3156608 RepID=UPI0032B3E37A
MNTQQKAQRAPRKARPPSGSGDDARRKYEHFTELARAETAKGDAIAAENYLQYAEHYYRSMANIH